MEIGLHVSEKSGRQTHTDRRGSFLYTVHRSEQVELSTLVQGTISN